MQNGIDYILELLIMKFDNKFIFMNIIILNTLNIGTRVTLLHYKLHRNELNLKQLIWKKRTKKNY